MPEIYVALKPGFEPSKEIEAKVVAAIETHIGKIRSAEECVYRAGHAEDSIGQTDAPCAGLDLQPAGNR